jgi:hypothetical protein
MRSRLNVFMPDSCLGNSKRRAQEWRIDTWSPSNNQGEVTASQGLLGRAPYRVLGASSSHLGTATQRSIHLASRVSRFSFMAEIDD